MNVTLSIDDDILARAQHLASRRGTSVDRLVQDYLEEIASAVSADQLLVELDQLWSANSGDSRGRTWTREELHERSGIR